LRSGPAPMVLNTWATCTRVVLINDIVISIALFFVISLWNTDGTVVKGDNSAVCVKLIESNFFSRSLPPFYFY
jgi:hypothetical protein